MSRPTPFHNPGIQGRTLTELGKLLYRILADNHKSRLADRRAGLLSQALTELDHARGWQRDHDSQDDHPVPAPALGAERNENGPKV